MSLLTTSEEDSSCLDMDLSGLLIISPSVEEPPSLQEKGYENFVAGDWEFSDKESEGFSSDVDRERSLRWHQHHKPKRVVRRKSKPRRTPSPQEASASGSRIPKVGAAKDKRRSLLPGPASTRKSPPKSPPAATSHPPQASSDPGSPPHKKFYDGDRVTIGGVKPGIVRYFGRTHFSEGYWCGVELDDPDGRHDGTLEGVRYFCCGPDHGIFAPCHKVELLATKRQGSPIESVSKLKQPRTTGLLKPRTSPSSAHSKSPPNGSSKIPGSKLPSLAPSKLLPPRSLVKPSGGAVKPSQLPLKDLSTHSGQDSSSSSSGSAQSQESQVLSSTYSVRPTSDEREDEPAVTTPSRVSALTAFTLAYDLESSSSDSDKDQRVPQSLQLTYDASPTSQRVAPLQSPLPDLLTPSALFARPSESGGEAMSDLEDSDLEDAVDPMAMSTLSHASSLGILAESQLCQNSLLAGDVLPDGTRRDSQDLLEVELEQEISGISTPDVDMSSSTISGRSDGDVMTKSDLDSTFNPPATSTPSSPLKKVPEVPDELAASAPSIDLTYMVKGEDTMTSVTPQPPVSMATDRTYLCEAPSSSGLVPSGGDSEPEEAVSHGSSMELAIVAVEQYADLMRGAQEEQRCSQERLKLRDTSRTSSQELIEVEEAQEAVVATLAREPQLTKLPSPSREEDIVPQVPGTCTQEPGQTQVPAPSTQEHVQTEVASTTQLRADLAAGHTKRERPVSTISSCSADTGIPEMMRSTSPSLQSQLAAGHTRRERPVSTISSCSADTGLGGELLSPRGGRERPLSMVSVASTDTGYHGEPDAMLMSQTLEEEDLSVSQTEDRLEGSSLDSSLNQSDSCSEAGTLVAPAGTHQHIDSSKTQVTDSNISSLAASLTVQDPPVLSEISETEESVRQANMEVDSVDGSVPSAEHSNDIMMTSMTDSLSKSQEAMMTDSLEMPSSDDVMMASVSGCLDAAPVMSESRDVLNQTDSILLDAAPVMSESKDVLNQTDSILLDAAAVMSESKDVLNQTDSILLDAAPVMSESRDVLNQTDSILLDASLTDSCLQQEAMLVATSALTTQEAPSAMTSQITAAIPAQEGSGKSPLSLLVSGHMTESTNILNQTSSILLTDSQMLPATEADLSGSRKEELDAGEKEEDTSLDSGDHSPDSVKSVEVPTGLARLEEEKKTLEALAELTCDSEGVLDQLVSAKELNILGTGGVVASTTVGVLDMSESTIKDAGPGEKAELADLGGVEKGVIDLHMGEKGSKVTEDTGQEAGDRRQEAGDSGMEVEERQKRKMDVLSPQGKLASPTEVREEFSATSPKRAKDSVEREAPMGITPPPELTSPSVSTASTVSAGTAEKKTLRKPSTKVASRIADYIKKPPAAKTSEEPRDTNPKVAKNATNKKKADLASTSGSGPRKLAGPVSKGRRGSAPVDLNASNRSISARTSMSDISEEKAKKPGRVGATKGRVEPGKEPTKPKVEVRSRLGIRSNSTTVPPKPLSGPTRRTSLAEPKTKSAALRQTAGDKVAARTTAGRGGLADKRAGSSSSVDLNASRGSNASTRSRASLPAKVSNRTATSLRQERSPSTGSDSQLSTISQVSSQGTKSRVAAATRKPPARDPGKSLSRLKRGSVPSVEAPPAKHPGPTLWRRVLTTQCPTEEQRRASVAVSSRVSSRLKKEDANPVAASSPRKPLTNQNRNKTTKSSVSTLKRANQPDLVTNSVPNAKAVQEVARLEALCESRTKELTYAKMQLKQGLQGFDAMAALVRYLTEQLDAFSCPMVTARLQEAQEHLQRARTQLDDLTAEKTRMEVETAQIKATFETEKAALNKEHQEATNALEIRLRTEAEQAVHKVVERHSHEVTTLNTFHERTISNLKSDQNKELQEREQSHKDQVKQLVSEHEHNLADLQKQHETNLEEITMRFENIKVSLHEKVEFLRAECEEMKRREKTYMETCQRDSDVKVQMALAPFRHLPQEIESMRAVMDMRNQEIHELRRQKLELEKRLEELPGAQDRVQTLERKVENLEAIIAMKAEYEKTLSEKHQTLLRRLDREAKANKRLSMDNEELAYRLQTPSSPVPIGTLDGPMHRSLTHSPPQREAEPVMRRSLHFPVQNQDGVVMRHRGSPPRDVVMRRNQALSPPSATQPQPIKRRKSPVEVSADVKTDREPSWDSSSESSSSPVKGSPPKSNLKRSGTYDLLDTLDDSDLQQSDI